MMKNAFLLCLFVVVLCSCQEKTVSSTLRAVDRSIPIDINKLTEKEVVYNFTEIIDSIKVIVLDDSNEEALFSSIYELLITDKYIYIKDGSQYCALLIFDHDGKFVSKLPLGQGPGKIQKLEEEITNNASNFVKLNELTKEKENVEETLSEKMDRWVYLNDLNDRINNQ